MLVLQTITLASLFRLEGFSHFSLLHYFLNEREYLFILGILCLSVSVIGKNVKGMITQAILLPAFWVQYFLFALFEQIFTLNHWMTWFNYAFYFLLSAIQIVLFVLVCAELAQWIKKEAPLK